MYNNFVFNDVNDALPVLLMCLDDADEVGSRAGRTKELTHVGITLTNPVNREILLPSRKPNLAAQIAETMWILAGRSDIGWLEHYLPRVRDFSDDGETWRAGYGQRLRGWEGRSTVNGSLYTVDQIAWVVDHLRKDPASRRAVLSIWDPVLDTADGVKDIPCNDWLSFSSRLGKLDLHVAVRSNDVIWGWSGINQFEWSVLLEVIAGLLGLKVGSLHFSTTSFHIYEHHWAKSARIQENAYNVTGLAHSPRFDANALPSKDIAGLDKEILAWFRLENDIRSGNMRESDVDAFPEPMLRSWLRVLQWWWSGDRDYLEPLENTRLERASHYSVQPPEREQIRDGAGNAVAQVALSPNRVREPSEFIKFAIRTHNEKHDAYGDSWKKRGESFSIIPNIARKVDRLGGSETEDESSADTAMDLMVYLAKYQTWLDDSLHDRLIRTGYPDAVDTNASDTPDAANEMLLDIDLRCQSYAVHNAEAYLKETFELLLKHVEDASYERKVETVNNMLWESYRLARTLWEKEQENRPRADVKMWGSREEDLGVEDGSYRGADVD